MQTAWRERNPEARIKAAKEAIELNPECATAYILLAEEESGDITEAENKLREAYRIAEHNHRRSQQLQHQSALLESQHRRDTNVMIYIRRRLAMCARKLGKLKEVRGGVMILHSRSKSMLMPFAASRLSKCSRTSQRKFLPS